MFRITLFEHETKSVTTVEGHSELSQRLEQIPDIMAATSSKIIHITIEELPTDTEPFEVLANLKD